MAVISSRPKLCSAWVLMGSAEMHSSWWPSQMPRGTIEEWLQQEDNVELCKSCSYLLPRSPSHEPSLCKQYGFKYQMFAKGMKPIYILPLATTPPPPCPRVWACRRSKAGKQGCWWAAKSTRQHVQATWSPPWLQVQTGLLPQLLIQPNTKDYSWIRLNVAVSWRGGGKKKKKSPAQIYGTSPKP